MKLMERFLARIYAPRPDWASIDLRTWREMPAGAVIVYEDKQGNRFSVMHEDDLEHVLELSNLRMADREKV